jgi:hypothetical protein
MSPKELTAFRIESGVMEGLRRVKERDGVPMSVQVHRALVAWLRSHGVTTQAERKRASTRKRP